MKINSYLIKNVLAFADSNGSTSINQKLVEFVTSEIKNQKTKVIELTNYSMPMYSEDEEKRGVP